MTKPSSLSIAQRLHNQETVVGTMIRMIRTPAIVPIAQEAGLDYIILDMEHGDYDFQTVLDVAQLGRANGFDVLVRVPELARSYVSRALDCGVTGVMVPMTESVQQAQNLVDWCKYPPLGRRGLATMGGMSGFTNQEDAVAFMAQSNRRVLAIAQIETAAAIAAIDEIAAVDGLDALLIGPNDLAVSLGKPGQLNSDEQIAAITRVADAAERHHKILGMHAGAAMLQRWVPRGLRLLMNGLDIKVMGDGLTQIAATTRALTRPAGAVAGAATR